MATITVTHFDTLEFVKKSKEFGANEQLAEYTARQIERVVAVVEQQSQNIHQQQIELNGLKSKEYSTQGDVREAELRLQKEIEIIRKEIALLRYDTLKFTISTGIGVVIALGGMLAKGFHWF